MQEMVKLLKEQSNRDAVKIKGIYNELCEVHDLVSLLKDSCAMSENKSMHTMLDMISKKLFDLRSDKCFDLRTDIDLFALRVNDLEAKLEKPKRTRTPRKPAENKDKKPVNNRKPAPKPKDENKADVTKTHEVKDVKEENKKTA